MILEMFLSSAIILFITGGALTAWVYRSILWPIGRLQEATKQIRTEIWILPWMWRMMTKSASFARILRRCGSG